MAVVSVGVVVQSGENDRSAGGATGGCAKSVREKCAIGGKCVHVGRLNDGVAIAAGIGALVVRDEEDDVFGSGMGGGCGDGEKASRAEYFEEAHTKDLLLIRKYVCAVTEIT